MRSWFSRHLNWTYFFAWLFLFILAIILGLILGLAQVSENVVNVIDVIYRILAGVGMIIVSLWILGKKNQSWAWIFLGFILAPLWLPTKKPRNTLQLSSIYKRTEVDKFIHANPELRYLQETMSCTNCAFADRQAMAQGNPWCDAPVPPVIENNYCHTWERTANG